MSPASDHLSALHLCLYSPSVCPCWLFFQPESANPLLLPGFPPLVSPLGTHTATALTFMKACSHGPSAQNLQRFCYFPCTHLPGFPSSPRPSAAPLHPLPSIGVPSLLPALPPCDVFCAPRGDALLSSPSLFPPRRSASPSCSCSFANTFYTIFALLLLFCLIIEMNKMRAFG